MARATRRSEVTEVLRERILSRRYLGLLQPGDRLPSVRDSALEFGADPRVVLLAYRGLAREGLVELRNRSGVYVSADASREETIARRSNWLSDVLVGSLSRGVPAPELSELLLRSLATLRLRAVVLECNDDQLWSMSDELRRDYGLDVTPVDVAVMKKKPERRSALPRGVDLVVTTAPHARDAARLAKTLGCPSLAVSMCPELFAEVRRLLTHQPVHFIVSDRRFAMKLRRTLGSPDATRRLRVAILGRDDLETIPPDVPLYLTRRTRFLMSENGSPASRLLGRGLPEARVLSVQSRRQLLDFVTSRNLTALAALR